EFARAALELAGVDAPVEPVTTAAFGARAPRPAYSVLASTRLAAAGEPALRPWREALAPYLADRQPPPPPPLPTQPPPPRPRHPPPPTPPPPRRPPRPTASNDMPTGGRSFRSTRSSGTRRSFSRACTPGTVRRRRTRAFRNQPATPSRLK